MSIFNSIKKQTKVCRRNRWISCCFPNVACLYFITIIFYPWFPWRKLLQPLVNCVSSVQLLSRVRLFATPWTVTHQASLSITNSHSLFNGLNGSMDMSQWCHPTISSSVLPFFSCLQSFPASGSFQMSQFFATGGQSIGVSASASVSVLPVNIQGWIPFGLTGLISL